MKLTVQGKKPAGEFAREFSTLQCTLDCTLFDAVGILKQSSRPHIDAAAEQARAPAIDPALARQLDAQNALIAQLQQEKADALAREQSQTRERETMARQLDMERLRALDQAQASERERVWREEKDRLLAQQAAMMAQQATLVEKMERMSRSVQDQQSQREQTAALQAQLDQLRFNDLYV